MGDHITEARRSPATVDRSSDVDGALSGLKVLELGHMVSAPYAAKLLADFGADVVKVEDARRPDRSRDYGPFPGDGEESGPGGLFLALNVNKRGIALDLAQPEGRDALHTLLAKVDIVLTNWSAADLEELGIQPETLRSRYPDQILTVISSFGLTGPRSDWIGGELVVYAAGGMAYGTPGPPDMAEDPEVEGPLHPNAFVAGTVGGIVAAVATMVAVTGREMHGGGSLLDISEQAAVAAMDQRDFTAWIYGGVLAGRQHRSVGGMPNYYLPSRDGYVVVASPLDHMWLRLVQAMGNPEWASTEAFSSADARRKNWDALKMLIQDWTKRHDSAKFPDFARQFKIPLFPYHSVKDIVNHPHSDVRESFAELNVGDRRFKIPAPPMHFGKSPWKLRRLPPQEVGEDTQEVLAEWLNSGKEGAA